MKIFIIVSALLLAGCSTIKDNVVYKDVLVPVTTKCSVIMPERTVYISDLMTESDSIFDKMKSLLIDKKSAKVKEEELRELLKVCIN